MIHKYAVIHSHTIPYEWLEILNTFSDENKKALSDSYPADHYRTISEQSHARQYHYDARGLISLSGKLNQVEMLSEVWQQLVQYLNSKTYKDFIFRITGIQVAHLPVEANLYKYHKDCFMDAHQDMKTKVLTHVIYFNTDWLESDGGCLRILNSSDPEDVHTKVLPNIGNSVVIIRSDTSWHSVEKTRIDKSRRAITITFYTEGATSPMWDDRVQYDLHSNDL